MSGTDELALVPLQGNEMVLSIASIHANMQAITNILLL